MLPDGGFCKGKPDKCPQEGTLFRTYAQSLSWIITLYLSQPHGMGTGKIARLLNMEGYPFRSEQGQPCAFCSDDVRRTLADWPAYAGYYPMGRAKDRPGHRDIDPKTVTLNKKRTLFPLDDLKRIARLRKQRGIEPPADDGIISAAKAYPLAQLVRCTSCEAQAVRLNDERHRTRLGGHTPNARRYRHPNDVPCACVRKSVLADELEALFSECLLSHLQPNADLFRHIFDHAHAADCQPDPGYKDVDNPNGVRLRQIKRGHEQLRRLERSYQALILTDAAYDKQRALISAQLAEWEAQPPALAIRDLPLADFIQALQNPVRLWDTLDDEGRRTLAHSLFSYLLYDLDQHTFTEYHLTEWSERFFVLIE